MNELCELRNQLEKNRLDYLMLEPLQPERAHFKFIANFQGREIIWDAELIPLKHTEQSLQSVQVGSEAGATVSLEIILDLPRITEPDILKSIIMIRNYKRLRVGRHEWSPL